LERLLQSQGHDVAFLAMQHEDNLASEWQSYWPAGVEYRGTAGRLSQARLFRRSVWSFEAARAAQRLLDDFRPDLMHVHSIHHHLTLSVVDAAVKRQVPVVWTLHDYRTVCPATHLLRGGVVCERCAGGAFVHCVVGRCKDGTVARSLAAAAESYLVRAKGLLGAIDCFVAPSAFLARKVLQMGLPARRVAVLRNFWEPGEEPRCGEAVEASRAGVLFVGRLSKEKGVRVLVSALARCRGVPLRVVGDGPERAGLERCADGLNVRAEFLGWLPGNEVRRELRRAAVLCVPSVWFENAPLVVLEAMAERTPVVVSDIGGLGELVDGGRAGWLARVGDPDSVAASVARVLTDAPAAQAKADIALSRLEEVYSAERYLQEVKGIYRNVAARAGRAASGGDETG
jgi:glycosyltransferase involved in cell wall biosynthesis